MFIISGSKIFVNWQLLTCLALTHSIVLLGLSGGSLNNGEGCHSNGNGCHNDSFICHGDGTDSDVLTLWLV